MPWRIPALATLAALVCLGPLPARALPSGSTYAFFSVTGVNQVEDNRTGLGQTSQITYDSSGILANAFATNPVPFGAPPALGASASLQLDGTQPSDSYQSWAAAVGKYDYEVVNLLDPSATGPVVIQGIITLSGTLVGNPSVLSSVVSAEFSFRNPVPGGAAQSVACGLSSSAGGALCNSTTADFSGVGITQLSATEWEISGPVIFDITVMVNAVNALGGQLTTQAAAGLSSPFYGASLFDETLMLEYTSDDPAIQITLVPEPGPGALLALGLTGLAVVGRRRAAR